MTAAGRLRLPRRGTRSLVKPDLGRPALWIE